MADPPILHPEAPTMSGSPPYAGMRRAALGFIFVAALMDILAIGVIIPVLPRLVQSFTGGDAGRAAGYVGVFGAAWALMQFIFSPIQGALSDHFGRRPVLLASIFGLGADYVLMALAPSLVWLFVGRIISGITAASFSTANAYIADVTPPEKRAASFGLLGAAFGIGFILGPTLGGLCSQVSLRLPFWVSAGLAFANGLYGLFVLPESLPRERRAPFKLMNANPLGSLKLLTKYPGLIGLAAILFLCYLSQQVFQSVMVLYTDYRFGWTPLTLGIVMAFVGLCSITVQAGLVKPFVARFKERGALYTGLAFAATGMAIWGLGPTGGWFWGGVPVYAISGLVNPGAQGMMTRRVGPAEQGRLQGANAAIMAAAGLIGPLMFTQVFRQAIAGARAPVWAGLPFDLGAVMLVAALLVALGTRSARQVVDGVAEPAIVAP